MPKRISIDPVTRIEGHLAIETVVENGTVIDARVAGRMYRGFEQLLLNRHPVDAARITQRVCGICHEVHGIAASIALEDLYRLTPTRNGLILRDLILGLHLVTDHIFHFYQLTLPDYLDFSLLGKQGAGNRQAAQLARIISTAGTFAPSRGEDLLRSGSVALEMALGYAEAVAVRKSAGSGLASLGGKVPFCHAILPGGVTTNITSDRLARYSTALEETATFVRQSYLPHAQALAEEFRPYFSKGRSHGNFYDNGGFALLQEPLYRSGVVFSGKEPQPFRFDRVEEVGEASFANVNGKQSGPPGAYSWIQALHYNGRSVEVGPLARLAVNRDNRFASLLKHYQQNSIRSSVMARILARAFEAQKICDYLLELLPSYRLDQATINPPDMQARANGSGTGLSLAARGALIHQLTANDGKIARYRLLVPSAWNFGPTARRERGTVEAALIGTPVTGSASASPASSLEIGRIVRSFDPCLACAIH